MEDRLSLLREQAESPRRSASIPCSVPREKRDLADDLLPLWELEQEYRRILLRSRVESARIEHLILKIPSPLQKKLLRARYIDGLSWYEIGNLLSLSESTVFALHKKALAALEADFSDQSTELPISARVTHEI